MPYNPTVPTGNRPYDLYKNQFSNVGGSVLTQKVVATFDIFNPIERVIHYRHGDYVPFIMLFKALGYSRGASNPTIGHFERLWDENTIKVGALTTAAGSAGAAAVITLHADNMVNVGATVNGSARQGSIIRLNDEVQLKTGQAAVVTAIDRTVTPHRVTLMPKDGTVTLNGSLIAANDIMIITGNSYSEGSGLGEGLTPQYIRYANTFQIIKERASTTGSQQTNANRVNDPMVGVNGQQTYFDIVSFDAEKRFEKKKSMTLLAGQQNTNAALYDFNSERGVDAPLTGTEGFLKFAELNGNTTTYSTITINTFDTLNRIFMNERVGTKELMTLDGYQMTQNTENALLNYFNKQNDPYLRKAVKQANAAYGDQPYSETDLEANMGFKCVTKGGFTYRFSNCHEFNDIQSFNATGFNYSSWRLVMPMGMKLNIATNQQTPMCGYEYKELNGYSRENIIGNLSGAGIVPDVPTNQYDIKSTFMISEIAAHMACANAIVRQIPA